MQTNTEIIKQNIKRELKKNNISIKSLSIKLGLHHRFFSEMDCIKIERLMKISEVTGISIYNFIDDVNYKKFYDNNSVLIKIEKNEQ